MSYLTQDARQAILNRVYTHFIVNQQPAGRLSGASCIYHGLDKHGRRVSCAIGIFDTEGRLDQDPHPNMVVSLLYDEEPDVLSAVFDTPDLGLEDIQFLEAVQEDHDMAVKHAADPGHDFDRDFREELHHRLTRLAGEQSLKIPSEAIHLN